MQSVVGKSHPSTVDQEEGRYSLGKKQQSPNTASAPYPMEATDYSPLNGLLNCPYEYVGGFREGFRKPVQAHKVPNPVSLAYRCVSRFVASDYSPLVG